MALHVTSHVEELSHQVACLYIIIYVVLIVEEQPHQSCRVGILQLCCLILLIASASAQFLYNTIPRLVQIVLQRLAHVVMDPCCWIGSRQLLALGNHREDTTEHGGAACIDLHILGLENLREVLRHALADTMMLALAYSGEIAQALMTGGIERLQFP